MEEADQEYTPFMQGYFTSETERHDKIGVSRMYIDITGSLIDGIILSRIMYWFTPDKKKRPKAKIIRDGHRWIAKNYDKWWDECRIEERTARASIARMVKSGLLIKAIFKFGGKVTVHLRVNWTKFEEMAKAYSVPIRHLMSDRKASDVSPDVKSEMTSDVRCMDVSPDVKSSYTVLLPQDTLPNNTSLPQQVSADVTKTESPEFQPDSVKVFSEALEDPIPPVATAPLSPLPKGLHYGYMSARIGEHHIFKGKKAICGNQSWGGHFSLVEQPGSKLCPDCDAKLAQPKPQLATQPHMLPIEAWCKELNGTLPTSFKMGAFSRVSKEWHNSGVTPEQMQCAALLFKAWIQAHPGAPVVNWQVGPMRGVIDGALALCRMGVTPPDMMAYVKEQKGKDFWSGKSVSFDYVTKNLPTWKIEKAPHTAKPGQADMAEYIPDPDNPGIQITRRQLLTRQRDKELIEKEYGRAS